MASVYPSADVELISVAVAGAPTAWQAVDRDTASYIEMSGVSLAFFALAPNPLTVGQFAAVHVEFDARPTPNLSGRGPFNAWLRGYAGTYWSQSVWAAGPQTSFGPSTVYWGSIVSQHDMGFFEVLIEGTTGDFSDVVQINDVHMAIDVVYNMPTAVATGPTGSLTDNTPTLTWTTTVDNEFGVTETGYRWRIFTAAQYSAGGFDPNVSPAVYDSGGRSITASQLHAFTVTTPLAAGAYRAYVSAVQTIDPGAPYTRMTSRRQQPGLFTSFVSFTVIPPLAAYPAPVVPTDVVLDLTATQRAMALAPNEPIIRATLFMWDGTTVRDLDLVDGSVKMSSLSFTRATCDFTCSDTDLVPLNRVQALDHGTALHPFGSYVHLARGFRTGQFSQVLVSLGTFRLTRVQRDLTTGRVSVRGADFGLNLQESRFAYPVTRQNWDLSPPTPNLITDTARAIITEAGLAYSIPVANTTRVVTNYTNAKGDERPKALEDLARGIAGWVWYAQPNGVIYFGPGPTFTDPIVYRLGDGNGFSTTNREAELERDGFYDVVIASDQSSLFIGGAYDAAVDSIIHRSAANPAQLATGAGAFSPGGKVFFYSSPVISSLPGAQSAARTRLANVAFPADSATATGSPLPDLRPDKLVAMPRVGATEFTVWQVTDVTMPLDPDSAMRFSAVTQSTEVSAAS